MCFLSVGCRTGYFGDGCVNRCLYPSYGKECQKNCHCIESDCNFITGCDNSSCMQPNIHIDKQIIIKTNLLHEST